MGWAKKKKEERENRKKKGKKKKRGRGFKKYPIWRSHAFMQKHFNLCAHLHHFSDN